jgi:hypothetical protein
MSFTQRRTTRLALAVAAAATLAGGLTAASDLRSGSASTPQAYDYCVTVPPIWVHGQTVYPGGLYCVPVPFSQPT